MFATAQTLKTGPVSAKAKKAPPEIRIEGIESVAALDAVIKSLTALKQTFEAQAKGNMTTEFVKLGVAKGARPDNFRGVEGAASASCEMRARSSASPFQTDEIQMLAEAEIPTRKIEDGVATFGINPAHLNNAEMLKAMEKALQPLVAKGKLPTDLFVKLEPPTRTVLAEGALDVVFSRGEATVRKLLPVVTTMAIKPTLGKDATTADAFKLVEKLLAPTEAKEAA